MATSTTNSNTDPTTVVPSADAPAMERTDGSDAKKQVELPWGKIDAPTGDVMVRYL